MNSRQFLGHVAQQRARSSMSAEIARSAMNRDAKPGQGEWRQDVSSGDKQAKCLRMSQGVSQAADTNGDVSAWQALVRSLTPIVTNAAGIGPVIALQLPLYWQCWDRSVPAAD